MTKNQIRFMAQISVFVFIFFIIHRLHAGQESNIKYKIGGQVGQGFMLTDITTQDLHHGERWIFSITDRFGRLNKSLPPYYHIEQKNSQLLFLDLAQTSLSSITNDMIISRMKKSKLFQNIEMTIDPVDQSMNLRLQLKSEAKFKAYQVRGQTKTSKIVLDLQPSRTF